MVWKVRQSSYVRDMLQKDAGLKPGGEEEVTLRRRTSIWCVKPKGRLENCCGLSREPDLI